MNTKTVYTIPADLSTTTFTFENVWKGDLVDDDLVWNTGLSAATEPHADEDYSYSGEALKEDTIAYKKRVASFQLYKTNQWVDLKPGDKMIIAPKTKEEVAYYLGIKDNADSKLSITYTPATIEEIKSIILSGAKTVEVEGTTTITNSGTVTTVTWASDNEAVATVAAGVVTGVAEGTATITASSTTEGLEDSITIEVVAKSEE